MKTFTILGTGWLGLELAKTLKNDFNIKVSSRTEEKISFYEDLGFETYILNEHNTKDLSKLLNCDYLFINYPPSKFEDYLKFLEKIYSNKMIQNIKSIIFVSSTSIYPKEDGVYTEESKIIVPSSQKVFDAENFVNSYTKVIFRCSGLIGGTRVAGRRLANKEVKDSNSKINYIHRDDIISATKFVIENDINGVFNLCAPLHPTKKEVYSKNSKKYGFETPIFLNTIKKDRVVDGNKNHKTWFQISISKPFRVLK